jgi:hypothetical protein
VKSKELFPQVFGRHALAYQQRIEQVMARGEARGRLRVLELVDVQPGMRVLDLALRSKPPQVARSSASTSRRG